MSILEINDLNINIKDKTVITNGNLCINPGDVILLTGSNGSGKSTIIKSIMGDLFDYGNSIKLFASKLDFELNGNILDLRGDEKNREIFRRNVCYISQEDEFESNSVLECFLMSLNYLDIDNPTAYIFDFAKRYSIYEGFGVDDHIDSKSKKIIKAAGIKRKDIKTEDVKAAKYLSMNTKKMSGGQKKLTNILANIVKCAYCQLVLLDEPLNNLDYNNVRAFSNTLTRIHKAFPNIGILMVTHCRSIPIVNKVIEIDPESKTLKTGGSYSCNSCFGKVDSNVMYI